MQIQHVGDRVSCETVRPAGAVPASIASVILGERKRPKEKPALGKGRLQRICRVWGHAKSLFAPLESV